MKTLIEIIILFFLSVYIVSWGLDIKREVKSLKAQQNTIQIMASVKYSEYIKHIKPKRGLKRKSK